MRTRLLTSSALAVIATLSIADASFAQNDRRIPLRKGEMPAPARVDTVILRDTVRITDTVTVARVDTVIRGGDVGPIVEAPITPLGRFYAGLNAGAALPLEAMNIAQGPGFTVGGLLGWDANNIPLGLRVDGGFTRMQEESGPSAGCPGGTCPDIDGSPQMWHLNLDGKLRLPFQPLSLYAVGGATWNRYRGFTFVDDDNDTIISSSSDWDSRWGYNVGGGLAFGFGKTQLFLEARYQSMTIGDSRQNHVPIVLGFTF
jgi:opacity protein-like surface antigen